MATLDVLVVGDANPDLVLTGDVVPRFGQQEQLLDGAALVLGGSAAIMACGLARLDVRVALAAYVGDDVFGRETCLRLADGGVDIERVRAHPSLPTGLTVVLSTGDDRAVLTSAGSISTMGAADVTDADLQQVRHLHVASFFLQPRLAAELGGLLTRARKLGVTTSLDTNWDPEGRWSGLDDVLPLVDVLFVNTAELVAVASAVLGEQTGASVDHAGRALSALGPTLVLKDGARGGRAWSSDGSWQVPSPPVHVVDAVGAGDSFDAGFVAAYLRGMTTADALRWGVACGSLSTQAAGGTAAQPDRSEVDAMLVAEWDR